MRESDPASLFMSSGLSYQHSMDIQASAVRRDVEAHLVFRLARGTMMPRPSLDFGGVTDWHRLLQLASDENALIALREALKVKGGNGMPAEVERRLAILSLDREFRMRRLKDRLEQAIAALHRVGIDALLLKGAALAQTHYGSFAARPMRDIDLLVRPEQADDARASMLRLGWEVDSELPDDRTYLNHHHLPPLRDLEGSGLRLEIHRSLLPAGHPFHFSEDEIWDAAQWVKVGGGQALVMHPSHHAVHVAIHFAWSHMLKLGAWHAFRDLATLGTTASFDWYEFATTAARWGASSCCYWTLRLGHAMSGLTAPRAVKQQLCPSLPELVRRPLARHFIRALVRSEPGCPSARLDRALWSLAMLPHQEGHGGIRPWLVSPDLLLAMNERTRLAEGETSGSPFLQVRRSGRYITELIA